MVKRIHLRFFGFLFFLGFSALNGCVSSASQSQTPIALLATPSTTRSPISAMSPPQTPLAAHPTTITTPSPTPFINLTNGFREWLPEPILIQAGTFHDLKTDPFNRDPSFVLYSSGALIQKVCSNRSCQYLTTNLNTREMCILLNTIELYGFFDYDPASYQTPLAGGEISYIEVAAWRSQLIALYQLKDWLEDPKWLDRLLDCDDCRKAPEIKPALSETYWLLEDLEIPGAVVYQPASLALWLSEPQLAGDPVDWAVSTPSLSRLAGMSQCPTAGQYQAVVLTGDDAENTSNYINQVINQGHSPIFEENGVVYQITTRWLLPYEQAAGCGESINHFPSADIPQSNELMSCKLSDGIIPTPTSTWIP